MYNAKIVFFDDDFGVQCDVGISFFLSETMAFYKPYTGMKISAWDPKTIEWDT